MADSQSKFDRDDRSCCLYTEEELKRYSLRYGGDGSFEVEIGEFTGPLDVLLHFIISNKIDVSRLSISVLSSQYLKFLSVKEDNFAVVCDYLVMISRLCLLKLQRLLPELDDGIEEMAETQHDYDDRSAYRKIKEIVENLEERPQKGKDFFARGKQELDVPLDVPMEQVLEVKLYDILKSYVLLLRNQEDKLRIRPLNVFPLSVALSALSEILDISSEWQDIYRIVPYDSDFSFRKSAISSALCASLELARRSDIEIKQEESFGRIYLRRK